MNSFALKIGRPLATVSLAALLAAMPLTVDFAKDGSVTLKPTAAMAESGSGKDGDGGSDSSGSGGDDGGSDNSGSGSDDGGSDSSGSGGDDGGSDNSGSGGGSDDGGNSGSGSDDSGSDDSGSDDSSSDDSSSGSSGSSSSDDSSGSSSGSSSSFGSDDQVSKVEIEGNNIEVTFADGTKIEIENGIFERKDATGRTVEQRPATQEDYAALEGAAAGSGGSTSIETVNSDGARIEIRGDSIEVTHADGWKEEIENGQYELKDPSGNTVIERPAVPADEARLRGIAGA